MKTKKTKLMLKTDDNLWKKVYHHKIEYAFKTLNDAVVDLIQRGLNSVKKGKKNGV